MVLSSKKVGQLILARGRVHTAVGTHVVSGRAVQLVVLTRVAVATVVLYAVSVLEVHIQLTDSVLVVGTVEVLGTRCVVVGVRAHRTVHGGYIVVVLT